jgi:amidase
MLNLEEYLRLDACALAAGVRAGQFSSTDVMDCALKQARATNPSLNAIITENYAAARMQAQRFDANPELLSLSPVAGLPFLIKDLAAVSGLPLSHGSKLYAGFTPTDNAKIVQRYLDAGLLVIGKSNTPEFGLTLTTEPLANGITTNPWNPDFSTGGSSGGAAAAVAAGILPVAHATDGGGSIRIPAACCGLFGLKPSRGLTIIEDGLAESWSGMSAGHVISGTVRDSALFLDLVRLERPALFPLPAAPASFLSSLSAPLRPLRIALQANHPFGLPVHAECVAAIERTAKLCESLGHRVESIERPLDYQPVVRAMSRIISTHIWQSVSARLTVLQQSLTDCAVERSTRLMAELGSKVTADQYVEARNTLRRAELAMARFHGDFDVILSPVLAQPPAPLGWLDMNSEDAGKYAERFKQYSGFTALFNGTGQPSMSVPVQRAANGLPLGSMFTAAWGNDALLLQLAAQLEVAQPWPRHNAMA